ncbi:zinc-finger domain-containing protein [Caldibacillus thermoamylovorans]|uniref:zinc-finger domain-containing protein n=1 Tax=Caldibacillus thermoamylovorans TaxID=35841 RepID=UPI0022E0C32D|nr:zinc-finger domain-containing protein [Caldibacillus thermoamylovorans]
MMKKIMSDEAIDKERKALLEEIDELLKICDGCFVFQCFKKEKGRRFAHSFCINHCTVGMKLKETGRKLS